MNHPSNAIEVELWKASRASEPLVSVIIIFLNAGQFLEEAIDSVFSQTYDHWELILVDDGSIDESTSIALRTSQFFSEKVRYLEHTGHQNLGMPASRNLGLKHSKGEYISFLDADDIWFPEKLEQQIVVFKDQPDAAMVYGTTQYWYSWTQAPEDRQKDYVPPLCTPMNILIQPAQLLVPFFLKQEFAIPSISNVMVRRKNAVEVGGFDISFTSFNNSYEDQAFYAKICLQSCVVATNKCWDRYRQHPNSSSSYTTASGQEIEARRFFINWLRGYLELQRVSDPHIWNELRKELWRCNHPYVSHFFQRTASLSAQAWSLLLAVTQTFLPFPLHQRLRNYLKTLCGHIISVSTKDRR